MMDGFDIESSAATTPFKEILDEMSPAMKALLAEEMIASNLFVPGAVTGVLGGNEAAPLLFADARPSPSVASSMARTNAAAGETLQSRK